MLTIKRKLKALRLRQVEAIVAVGAFLALTVAGTASASTMHPTVPRLTSARTDMPTEGDNCGTNGSGVYNCMYIQGIGYDIEEMRGWSRIPANGPYGLNNPVHEEISGPAGAAVCNSATVTPNGSGQQIVDCQIGPGNYDYITGQYCSTLWQFIPGTNWLHPPFYRNVARNCVTIN